MHQRHLLTLFFLELALLTTAISASAQRQQRPPKIYKGESHVFVRGDVEILTFESEADFVRLEELYNASQKAAPAPGVQTTRYFRSAMDGSVQPYTVWLPKDYDPAKAYPLLIQLHGLGPKALAGARTVEKGLVVENWIDTDLPVIVVDAVGRGSTWYQGMGEQDVLEAISEARRRFLVDPERIFIEGHSMGGSGAYTVGLHYPDRFGSVMCGDPALGFQGRNPDADAWLPEWMRPQVVIQDAVHLYPNARNINVFFKMAGNGIGGTSTAFTDGIVAEGGFSTTESFPGMPHYFAPQLSFAIFEREGVIKPIQRRPAEVKFYTNTLQYNEAYWVTIDRLTRHNEDAKVIAQYDDGAPRPAPEKWGVPKPPPEPARPPSVKVTTININALTLRLGDAGVPKGASLPLSVDGQQVLTSDLPEVIKMEKTSGRWQVGQTSLDPHGKHHGVQGPIGDAFNSRFLAGYGEGDRDLAMAELDAVRNPPGELVNQGDFPMKAAAKVRKEDIESSNLLLFGTPATNPILKRIAPSLPPSLMSAIGGGEGVIFICPNPENPERYVVVWTTRLLSLPDDPLLSLPGSAGGLRFMLPVDLLPDFVMIKDGKIVRAGFLDNDWRLRN